ncbi:uncharacterized protein K452DRAFT_309887 [Aplosporella prunicola CBS 121167]|uniref:Uncharacterized protein n=1 Tax=Aplosporella prunicola CBS 121167 TaxID=1176127 RepID=A0A6A6B936_9PEZI|nr:uncharacterized protein K452DRAFT_309887 [Aplosporella prunicola CBS 121167]KAF2140792.1 hypothetical protein K452DRAFT_309887 [Aplosporella prunicola CBS 121167]
MDLAAPPESVHPTLQAARDVIKAFSKEHRYALSNKGTKSTKKGVPKKLRLRCDRAGTHISNAHVRNTGTWRTNYSFQLVVRRQENTHPYYRKITAEQQQQINTLGATSRPRQIRAQLLSEDPNSLITSSNIKNHQAKIRRLRLDSLTTTQRIAKDLEEDPN